MAGSGSIGTVCIPIISGSVTGSTSWASRSHHPYTSSHALLGHGIACPARLMVGSIWVRDDRVEEGRNGLHPHRFRVGQQVGLVLGKGQVAPCGHTHMHPPDVAHHIQYVSWLEASWCEMARPEFKGKVSIPIVSGSPRGRGGICARNFLAHQARIYLGLCMGMDQNNCIWDARRSQIVLLSVPERVHESGEST